MRLAYCGRDAIIASCAPGLDRDHSHAVSCSGTVNRPDCLGACKGIRAGPQVIQCGCVRHVQFGRDATIASCALG